MRPGDIAILIYPAPQAFIGTEVEIVSGPCTYKGKTGYNIMVPGYPCTADDSKHGEWFCQRKYLKKKRPPNKDIEETRLHSIEWDDCIWQPERVEA